MKLIINGSSMTPIYEQIMEGIRKMIASGELANGDALPSVRTLANELRISVLTVKKAYDRLEEEGFVVTVHGKGTYVAATDRQLAMEARKKAVEDDFAAAVEKARAVGFTRNDILDIVALVLEDYDGHS
jgi:GntR family transcriptional regulator